MTDQLNNDPGKCRVTDEEWAHAMSEAPEDSAVPENPRQNGAPNQLGEANETEVSDKAENADDYEVGYKKPPRHTRYRPGQSGNQKGRPKGVKNLKIDLVDELSERVTIKENGRQLKVSKQRLMIKALIAKAVTGDTRAANLAISLLAQTMGLDPEAGKVKDLSAEDAEILNDFMRQEMEADNG